jgi:hypothetical protein
LSICLTPTLLEQGEAKKSINKKNKSRMERREAVLPHVNKSVTLKGFLPRLKKM